MEAKTLIEAAVTTKGPWEKHLISSWPHLSENENKCNIKGNA